MQARQPRHGEAGGHLPGQCERQVQHNHQEVFDLLVQVRPALSLVILRKCLSCNIHIYSMLRTSTIRREEAPSIHHDDQGRKKDELWSLILYII